MREELEPIVGPGAALRRAVMDTVADLDAVSDVLIAQAVHALRGATPASPHRPWPRPAPAIPACPRWISRSRPGRPAGDRPRHGRARPGAVAPVWPGAASSPRPWPSPGWSAGPGRRSATRRMSWSRSAWTTRCGGPCRTWARRARRRLRHRRRGDGLRSRRGRRHRRRQPEGLADDEIGWASSSRWRGLCGDDRRHAGTDRRRPGHGARTPSTRVTSATSRTGSRPPSRACPRAIPGTARSRRIAPRTPRRPPTRSPSRSRSSPSTRCRSSRC